MGGVGARGDCVSGLETVAGLVDVAGLVWLAETTGLVGLVGGCS